MILKPDPGPIGVFFGRAMLLIAVLVLLVAWAGPIAWQGPGTAPVADLFAAAPAGTPTLTPPASPTPTGVAVGMEAVTAVASKGAINLSGEWRHQGVAQVQDALFAPDTDDSAWPITTAPARWTDQKINSADVMAVVYRRTVRVPAEWQGQSIGINAWFYPGSSMVYVNGTAVEPQGSLFAPYADVSGLLHYGQDNLIAVSTTGDGIRELAEMDPPLLGPLGQKLLTRVVRQEVTISTTTQPLKANLFYPETGRRLPVVVFAATGHADYPLKDDWQVLNEDMARLGYVSLAVAFYKFTPAEYDAVLQYLKGLDSVDSERVAMVGAMRATPSVVQAAVANEAVRAVILISSAKIAEIAKIGDRAVLFIGSENETGARTLSAARKMADQLQGPHDILALPGKSTGVNVLDTDWNLVRTAILSWLGAYLTNLGQ
jgi:hypothetical protein